MTEWRSVVGWDYEVSDDGQVRRATDYSSTFSGRPLKQRLRAQYLSVHLSHPTKGARDFHVHRLVLIAFRGLPPNGMQVAHLDGTRTNNKLENLCWVTAKENQAHRRIHGTWLEGENHPNHRKPERLARGKRHGMHTHPESRSRGSRNGWAKLTEGDVLDILASPLGPAALGHKYGVHYTTIQRIRSGERWGHVKHAQMTGEIPPTWSEP